MDRGRAQADQEERPQPTTVVRLAEGIATSPLRRLLILKAEVFQPGWLTRHHSTAFALASRACRQVWWSWIWRAAERGLLEGQPAAQAHV